MGLVDKIENKLGGNSSKTSASGDYANQGERLGTNTGYDTPQGVGSSGVGSSGYSNQQGVGSSGYGNQQGTGHHGHHGQQGVGTSGVGSSGHDNQQGVGSSGYGNQQGVGSSVGGSGLASDSYNQQQTGVTGTGHHGDHHGQQGVGTSGVTGTSGVGSSGYGNQQGVESSGYGKQQGVGSSGATGTGNHGAQTGTTNLTKEQIKNDPDLKQSMGGKIQDAVSYANLIMCGLCAHGCRCMMTACIISVWNGAHLLAA